MDVIGGIVFWSVVIISIFYLGWLYTLAGAVAIGVVLYIVGKRDEKIIAAQNAKEHQRQLYEEELAEIQAKEAKQQNYLKDLLTLGSNSLRTFEALPNHLLDAEALLDQAEKDFEDGAFAPFWDSIERATFQLGLFDGGMEKINTNAKRHCELLKLYESEAPRYPIVLDSVKGMVAGSVTTDRMKNIVRKAQCDFQFASIYEQRKTNQILIAGFTSLAQALEGIAQRIADSIDCLSAQVSDMSMTLEGTITSLEDKVSVANQSTLRVSESVQELNSIIRNQSNEEKERHDRALKMLDNIQRRRIPYPRKILDGAY